ncbi:HAD family hydrolase [Bilophila sp.]|uniref:D-glycero-alpha-D-manno-heptose-1,7-bisphosphate 7-phosphatase n=1 Tax=Bilophila sp. TaxID=1929485 RepID=UPI0030768C9C
MMNKALFLDRDGIINVDFGYVHKKEHIVFVENIFPLVRAANQKGYLVIIITNQAGIGRGYYTEEDFFALMHWMQEQFQKHGAVVHDVFYCPFHPVHGIGRYRRDSFLRKPHPGMIMQAAEKYEIDLAASVLVGDSLTDIQAGMAGGVGKLFLLAQDGGETPQAQTISGLSEVISHLS